MQEQPQYFSQLITHTRPIDGIQSTFEMIEHYDDGVGKVVLTM